MNGIRSKILAPAIVGVLGLGFASRALPYYWANDTIQQLPGVAFGQCQYDTECLAQFWAGAAAYWGGMASTANNYYNNPNYAQNCQIYYSQFTGGEGCNAFLDDMYSIQAVAQYAASMVSS